MFPIITSEQSKAAELVKQFGMGNHDYFKLWPDKQYMFSTSGNGVVAYGVSHKTAFVYGDPAAPPAEMADTIDQFLHFCKQEKLTPFFYSVGGDHLDVYRQHKLRAFKASEDAVVDLDSFNLAGKANKPFRTTLNRFEREGIRSQFFPAPVPDETVLHALDVSDYWLTDGHRERTFTLGRFTQEYVRQTPMIAVFDADDLMLAFVNLIPSYAPQTATLDMMRHRPDAVNGTMDYLFLKLFEHSKAHGFRYFNMGRAPIIVANPDENASAEEKLYYKMTHHLDSFFSMTGVRTYKAKFATEWEPSYYIYPHTADLPRIFRAFTALTELPENRKSIISKENRRLTKTVTMGLIKEINAERRNRRRNKRIVRKNRPIAIANR